MFEIVNTYIEQYISEYTKAEIPLLRKVREFTEEALPEAKQMLSGAQEGSFLKMVVQATGARNILELGTFTGYSSLWMAEGLTGAGEILTCELSPQNAKYAKTFFDQSPHKNAIRIIMGPALETIQKLQKEKKVFDLIFIDADKKNYPEYYTRCLEMVKRGGNILIDNTLWNGDVLHPKDMSSKAIHDLNKMIYEDRRVESVHIPMRDGIQWVRKL